MKIIRFVSAGKTYLGAWDGGATARRIEGDLFGPRQVTPDALSVDKLLAPLEPRDILCIGLNYREHAREGGAGVPENPILFIKNSATLQHPGDPIVLPRLSSQIDYECELAVVMGRDARNVPAEKALDYVLGYTAANDVSSRDWQRDKKLGGGQWCRAKSFDTFCPLGPCLVTADEIPDPQTLRLRTLLNGQVMQDHSTADMIFPVRELIARLSAGLTLRAGAVILTGTPQGVGFARTPPVWLQAGDRVVIEIEKIGRLENPVVAEA